MEALIRRPNAYHGCTCHLHSFDTLALLIHGHSLCQSLSVLVHRGFMFHAPPLYRLLQMGERTSFHFLVLEDPEEEKARVANSYNTAKAILEVCSRQVRKYQRTDEETSTMVMTNLDLDIIRTLVVASDLGGYGQAAQRLGRTPSAISLQMKKLQGDVGANLFRKNGRGVALTEAGEIVLRFGRRMLEVNDELLDTIRGASLAGSVRLGCSQDFAETVLPDVLSQFTKLYPLVQVEVRIEGNAALVEGIQKNQLDIALSVGQADQPTAEVLGHLQLVWIAGQEFTSRFDQPLPLVMLGPQCAFRKEAIQKLDDAKMRWRIAAVSPSLAGLWASAIGGLGVTARSSLGLPAKLVWDKALFDLPRLPAFPVTLHAQSNEMSDGVERLRTIIRDSVAGVLRTMRDQSATKQTSVSFSGQPLLKAS